MHRDSKQGMHKGAAAPLVGGAGAWRVPVLFADQVMASGVGGTRPPRLAPRRGKRERGRSKFLAAAGYFRPPAGLPFDVQADLSDRSPCRLLAIERRLDTLSPQHLKVVQRL